MLSSPCKSPQLEAMWQIRAQERTSGSSGGWAAPLQGSFGVWLHPCSPSSAVHEGLCRYLRVFQTRTSSSGAGITPPKSKAQAAHPQECRSLITPLENTAMSVGKLRPAYHRGPGTRHGQYGPVHDQGASRCTGETPHQRRPPFTSPRTPQLPRG